LNDAVKGCYIAPSISITYSADIRHILAHIGVETEPPRITPARVPPLCDGANAPVGEGLEPVPGRGEGCQAAPDFALDQRLSW